nr:hypothetical protein [Tanacetum cinerariifolium]
MTLSKTLQARLIVEDPQTAKESWDLIAEIFNDNKRTCCIALKAKLYSLKLGDLSIDAYYRKIESIDTILTSLGLPISIDDVVTIALEANSSNTIRHPTVVSGESNKPCSNFASGFCRFGDACKYMHGGVTNRGNSNTSPWSNNNSCPTSSLTTPPTMTPEQIVALIQSQQALLAQLRYNGNINATALKSNANNPTSTQQVVSGQLSSSVGEPGSNPEGHKTLMLNAFSAMTLQDPTSGYWNMDTGFYSDVIALEIFTRSRSLPLFLMLFSPVNMARAS